VQRGGRTRGAGDPDPIAQGGDRQRLAGLRRPSPSAAPAPAPGTTSPPLTLTFAGTGDWNTVRTLTVNVALAAGTNRLLFSNPAGPCPDFDWVTVLT
jgi:hypothetical protein